MDGFLGYDMYPEVFCLEPQTLNPNMCFVGALPSKNHLEYDFGTENRTICVLGPSGYRSQPRKPSMYKP